jgi:hypothetical protein
LKRSFNQSACVRIIHVIDSASTPLTMTGSAALWLQLHMCRLLVRACLSSRAESRMERLGNPRHGREGQRLSERE